MTWTLYGLYDPRTEALRYIGVTKDVARRAREYNRGYCPRMVRFSRWLQELQGYGGPRMRIFFVCLSWEAAANGERNLIDEFRAAGVALLNSCRGGKVSPLEICASISQSMRGRKNPHVGHKQSAETVAQRIATTKARGRTPALVSQFRSMLVNRDTPEYRKKLSDAMKRRWERREPALYVETAARAEQRRKRVLARWRLP